VKRLYKSTDSDKYAICSQWPNPCGSQDAQIVDGYLIDNPAVVINVGHHLQKHGVNSDHPLKLIITNTNDQAWDSDFNIGQILQYFSAPFNEGVDPGEFLWGPDLPAPYRSPQIFKESLDKNGLNNALSPVHGTDMTTATFKATTIDNPSFGVLAGQPVEILLLNLNVNIPTNVMGTTPIDEYTQPLAKMALDVAFNEDLRKRVSDFADGVSSNESKTS